MTYRDKDSKVPEYAELYEKHDFITAYGKHTDLRIAKDGPELAIGAKRDGSQDWEIHGQMQLQFLISRGLKPEHRLLDLGCGTGRLACQAIPYLNEGNYVGIDISAEAIKHCRAIETDKKPTFIHGDGSLKPAIPLSPFNIIFAHSVFTHLPADVIETIFQDLSKIGFGEFCFTYKSASAVTRSGLKQFQFPPSFFVGLARKYGMDGEVVPFDWPAGQKTFRVFR